MHLRPTGPPLRPASDGALRPARDRARVLLRLQRPRGCRRPRGRDQEGARGLRLTPAASDLYQEQILDHYKHLKNRGALTGATFSARDTNPLGADEAPFHLKAA